MQPVEQCRQLHRFQRFQRLAIAHRGSQRQQAVGLQGVDPLLFCGDIIIEQIFDGRLPAVGDRHLDAVRQFRHGVACMQFTAQVDLLRVLFDTPLDRRARMFDVVAMRFVEDRQHQAETNRHEVHQVCRKALRPVVVLGARAPADKPCPAMQVGEFAREVAHPFVFRYLQLFEDVGDDAFRCVVDFEDGADVQAAQEEAHVALRDVTPCGEEALFAFRHGPGRLAFIEEFQAALDYQFIELGADLGAVDTVDGLVDRAVAKQVGLQRICNLLDIDRAGLLPVMQRGMHVLRSDQA